MNESDLNRLMREWSDQPVKRVGPRFTGEVMNRLAEPAMEWPVGWLAGIAGLTLLASASIGYGLALTHDHGAEATTPPPLAVFGPPELLASR